MLSPINKRFQTLMRRSAGIGLAVVAGTVGYRYFEADDTAWQTAVAENTISSYNTYISMPSYGFHKAQAHAAVVGLDDNAYQVATATNTIASIREYVDAHPTGRHVEETQSALKNLDNVAWQSALAVNTVKAFNVYMQECFKCQHKIDANGMAIKLDDDAFIFAVNSANSADLPKSSPKSNTLIIRLAHLKNYLSLFPTGRHIAMVEGLIGWVYDTGGKELGDQVKRASQAAMWYLKAANDGEITDPQLKIIKRDFKLLGWDNAENAIVSFLLTRLGEIYATGIGVKQDNTESIKWYQAAGNLGNVDAQFYLGNLYYNQKNYDTSLSWFLKAADNNKKEAQYNVGIQYQNGQGVTRNDVVAAGWYRKAADNGLTQAQFQLGQMYYHGLGVPKSSTEAAVWYQKAADSNFADAEYALAKMHLFGDGVGWSFSEHRRLLELAAQHGSNAAKGDLVKIKDAESSSATAQSKNSEPLTPAEILGGLAVIAVGAAIVSETLHPANQHSTNSNSQAENMDSKIKSCKLKCEDEERECESSNSTHTALDMLGILPGAGMFLPMCSSNAYSCKALCR